MRSAGTDRVRALLTGRRARLAVVRPGERPLAWADIGRDVAGPGDPEATGGQWVGTSVALYVPSSGPGATAASPTVRLPWAEVEAADWDGDTQELHVVAAEPGGPGTTVHVARLLGADRLLQLVRERVTSALVHTRAVPLGAGGFARISARRAAGTDGPLTWSVELPRGTDSDEPGTAAEVAAALAAARADLGGTARSDTD